MWKKGVCAECSSETMVKKSRGRDLCRECFKEAKRGRKIEKIRRPGTTGKKLGLPLGEGR
jgi:hypothetical protein